MVEQGPTEPMSIEIDVEKYRQLGETFREKHNRIGNTLGDDPAHFFAFREILLDMRFLPAGRVQASVGSHVRRQLSIASSLIPLRTV